MTEDQWLTCNDPAEMLDWLRRDGTSDRKLRLYAVACCWKVRHLLTAEACQALDTAEGVAEGVVGLEERRRARDAAFHANWFPDQSTAHRRGPAKAAVCDALARNPWDAATGALGRAIWIGSLEPAEDVARVSLASLVRCIFGDPFRPLTFNVLLNDFVLAIARGIYEERAFERMPVLADALEEHGVTDAGVLAHCRADTPHARGCHVLDHILDKT